jgi:D-arabinose 1-dehydrogenase-like Zn-dependent alcohol dehydrogenase
MSGYRWLMTAPNTPMVREPFAPAPGGGEVLVEVAGCGICHTDLGYFYDGVRTNHALPLALGHEVSGRVTAAGTGADGWIGTMDKVEIRLSNLMAFDARALGNWGCPPDLYPAALDLVLDGKVNVKSFVEQHPLADINRVFEAVHHRDIKRRAILIP